MTKFFIESLLIELKQDIQPPQKNKKTSLLYPTFDLYDSIGHSEPAPTSAPSTGCPLLFSCG
jgi:hypothetical protein